MTPTLRKATILSLSCAALLAAPVADNNIAKVLLSDHAAYAKSEKSNSGGGNGGGNSASQSHGNSGNSGKSSSKNNSGNSSNNGNSGKSANKGNSGKSTIFGNNSNKGGGLFGQFQRKQEIKSKSSPSKSTAPKSSGKSVALRIKKTETTTPPPVVAPLPIRRNFNAQLGRLNSLKRNINGLMNSNDPHLAAIRDYLAVQEEAATARDTLQFAQTTFDDALSAFNALLEEQGLPALAEGATAQDTIDALNKQISNIEAEILIAEANEAELADEELELLLAELSGALEDLNLQRDTIAGDPVFTDLLSAEVELGDALTKSEELGSAISDDALRLALYEAINDNRVTGPEDITDEMMAWAKKQLGIEETAPIEVAKTEPDTL